MKSIHFIIAIIAFFPLSNIYANLPAEDETKCICRDEEIIEVPQNECVSFKIPFGKTVNENSIDLKGFFHLYALKPSPLLFTPQALQYHNYLLNGLQKILRNAAHFEMRSEYLGDGVTKVTYVDDAGNIYQSDQVLNDLPEDIDLVVRTFTEEREVLEFRFRQGESCVSISNKNQEELFSLYRRDNAGQNTTSTQPEYFDLYLENGDYIRYNAVTGAALSYTTSTGRVITANMPSVGLDIVMEDETIRQVFSAADGLADVVVTEPSNKYEIRLYSKQNVGTKVNGVYTILGEPHTVWKIQNPTPGQSANLKITKESNGISKDFNYQFSYNLNDWILTYPDNLAVVSKSSSWDYSRTVKTDIITEKSPDGTIAFQSANITQRFPYGDRLVVSILDPNGDNLRTTYTYNDQGLISSISKYNGFWETYQYDNNGRVIKIVSPWKNSEYKSQDNLNKVKLYSYSPIVENDVLYPSDKRPRIIEDKILGKVISRRFFAYYFENNSYFEVEQSITTENAEWNNIHNRKTVKEYYPSNADEASRGRLKVITHFDGKVETYQYQFGNWTYNANILSSSFSNGNGAALKVSKIEGTNNHTAGIAGKTKKIVQVFDDNGNEVLYEEYVFLGDGVYEKISSKVMVYNENHKLLNSYFSNGTQESFTWDCCNQTSYTTTEGIENLYVYDALGRRISETKVGIGLQPDIVKTFQYDSRGNLVAESQSADTLSLTEQYAYNIAGQKIKEVSTNLLEKTFSYIYGVNQGATRHGMITTTTLPGESTKIVATYCDGRTASITGTGVIPEYWDYGVDENGYSWSLVHWGGADSAVWKKVTYDYHGNIVKEERSGYNNSVVTISNFYDNSGRLTKKNENGIIKIFQYDELGNLIMQGVDVDLDDQLLPASSDRIETISQRIVNLDNSYWLEKTSGVYGIDGSADLTTTAIHRTRLTGFDDNCSSEIVEVDIAGNILRKKTFTDRAQKQTKVYISYPDSSIDEEMIFLNGLLISQRTRTNLTYLFKYDGLGRDIGIVDPRTGETSKIYYTSGVGSKGMVQKVEDAAGNYLIYTYSSSTGLVSKIENALSQKTYYEYTALAKPYRIWGDVMYPTELTYNVYGLQTGMKTFRTGTWNSDQWSEANSGDVTTWNYDPSSLLVVSKQDAAGKAVSFQYSSDGKILNRTWARLQENGTPLVTTYTYNNIGDLISITYNDGTHRIDYDYNRLGNISSVSDALGTHQFTYDNIFNVEKIEINGLYNKSVSYDYSESGNKGSPLGIAGLFTYGFDSYGRINKISIGNNEILYSRLSNSDLVSSISRNNGSLVSSYEYLTSSDNISEITIKNMENQILSNYEYTYNTLGKVTNLEQSGMLFTSPISTSYVYNARDEIISSSRSDNSLAEQFSFDSIGNRNSVVRNQDETSYVCNNLNQYIQIQTQNGTEDLLYDADGNALTFNGWSLAWNGENRLVRMNKGNTTILFDYDYQGRRIFKKVVENDIVTKYILFVYDGNCVIAELDGLANNAVIREYIWQDESLGQQVPIAIKDSVNNSVLYYQSDNNKNITDIFDNLGNQVAHYEYDSFGNTIVSTGAYAASNPIRFSSEYYDSESDLVYYNYRYYSPKYGRWLNRDPQGENGGLNLYAFCGNNPINYFDMLGLESCDVEHSLAFGDASNLRLGVVTVKLGFEFAVGVQECKTCCPDESVASYKKMNGSASFYISAVGGSTNWDMKLTRFLHLRGYLGLRVIGYVQAQGSVSLSPEDPCTNPDASTEFCLSVKGQFQIQGGWEGYGEAWGFMAKAEGCLGGEIHAQAKACTTCTTAGCSPFELQPPEIGGSIFVVLSASIGRKKSVDRVSVGGTYTLWSW